jgi:hypothetical protein
MSDGRSPDWSIGSQSNLTYLNFPHISLSNAENRRSLATCVPEILKKHPSAPYFGDDSNGWPINNETVLFPVFEALNKGLKTSF